MLLKVNSLRSGLIMHQNVKYESIILTLPE